MREMFFIDAYSETMLEEMERDASIFVIGTDIFERGGNFLQLKHAGKTFGRKRVIDAPISEAAMVGLSVGAAMTGLRPVCELNFEDFALGAMDEVINQAAKIRHMFNGQIQCPLVIRASAGSARSAGPQHSQTFETLYVNTPGLLVANPSTPEDVRGLLRTALRGNDPVIFLMHKMLSRVKGIVPEEDYTIPFGKGTITRTGRDVTIAAYSIMAVQALQAAADLEHRGISAEVIDLRTLAPLDVALVAESVKKTKRLVIAHEAYRHAGIGAEIAASIGEAVFDYLDAPIRRIGSKHAPFAFAKGLQEYIVPSKEAIVDAALSAVQGTGLDITEMG